MGGAEGRRRSAGHRAADRARSRDRRSACTGRRRSCAPAVGRRPDRRRTPGRGIPSPGRHRTIASSGSTTGPPQSSDALNDTADAELGEPVEARVVHPDPHREVSRRRSSMSCVAKYVTCSRVTLSSTRWPSGSSRRSSRHRHTRRRAAAHGAPVGDDVDLAADRAQLADGRGGPQRGAVLDGQAVQRGGRSVGRDDAGLCREDRHHVVGHRRAPTERRPAAPHLAAVDPLVWHADLVEARPVRVRVDRRAWWEQVEATGGGDDGACRSRLPPPPTPRRPRRSAARSRACGTSDG